MASAFGLEDETRRQEILTTGIGTTKRPRVLAEKIVKKDHH